MKPISDDIFLTLNTRPDLNYNEDYSSKSESPYICLMLKKICSYANSLKLFQVVKHTSLPRPSLPIYYQN